MLWMKIERGYKNSRYTAIFVFCNKYFKQNMPLIKQTTVYKYKTK